MCDYGLMLSNYYSCFMEYYIFSCKAQPCPTGFVSTSFNGTQCYRFNYQKPIENCGIYNGTAYLCDFHLNIRCEGNHCHCFGGYKYDFSMKRCNKSEPDHKSLINEYCINNDQCQQGLSCQKDKYICQCPSYCKFLKPEGGCDCGVLDFPCPTLVYIVGISLGALSVILWMCLVYKTLNPPKRPRWALETEDRRSEMITDHRQFSRAEEPTNVGHGYTMMDSSPPYSQIIVPTATDIGFSTPSSENNKAHSNPSYASSPHAMP